MATPAPVAVAGVVAAGRHADVAGHHQRDVGPDEVGDVCFGGAVDLADGDAVSHFLHRARDPVDHVADEPEDDDQEDGADADRDQAARAALLGRRVQLRWGRGRLRRVPASVGREPPARPGGRGLRVRHDGYFATNLVRAGLLDPVGQPHDVEPAAAVGVPDRAVRRIPGGLGQGAAAALRGHVEVGDLDRVLDIADVEDAQARADHRAGSEVRGVAGRDRAVVSGVAADREIGTRVGPDLLGPVLRLVDLEPDVGDELRRRRVGDVDDAGSTDRAVGEVDAPAVAEPVGELVDLEHVVRPSRWNGSATCGSRYRASRARRSSRSSRS